MAQWLLQSAATRLFAGSNPALRSFPILCVKFGFFLLRYFYKYGKPLGFNKIGGFYMTQGYCVKCKKKVEMRDPKESLTKRGTKIAKGKCPSCGTTVCRMGGL